MTGACKYFRIIFGHMTYHTSDATAYVESNVTFRFDEQCTNQYDMHLTESYLTLSYLI